MSKSGHLPAPLFWLGWFILYFATVLAVCGVTALIIFVLVGAATNPDLPVLERAIYGFKIGVKFAAMVWAPAISFVLCVMRAHRIKQRKEKAGNEV